MSSVNNWTLSNATCVNLQSPALVIDDDLSESVIISNNRSGSTQSDATTNFGEEQERSITFPYQPNTSIADQVSALARKYEIQPAMAERLSVLKDYEIVMLLDDSGSMMTLNSESSGTRWDEICAITKIVLEIGTIFDSNGVDIFFLNRPAFLRIKNPGEVVNAFTSRPSGYTPLADALRCIIRLPAAAHGNDKKLLIFIATDGAPTDKDGTPNLHELENVMVNERNADTTHVMFLPCTDELACMNYLNTWDQTMKNVDVTSNFRTERERIHLYRGSDYPFSIGDYVVKILIGAVDSEIDSLDEPNE